MWTSRAQQVDNSELHPATKTTSVQDVAIVRCLVSPHYLMRQGIE